MKRYQECNRIEKVWRRRWYIVIPFIAAYNYLSRQKIFLDVSINNELKHTDIFEYMSWKMCWRIALGIAQSNMKWYYTSEEVFERLNKKLKDD